MSGGARQPCPGDILLLLLQCCDDAENPKLHDYDLIAATYGYTGAWLRTKHNAHLRGEDVLPRARGGAHNVAVDELVAEMLEDLVLRFPASRLADLQLAISLLTGRQVSCASISRSLKTNGISLKRKTTLPKSKFTTQTLAWHARYLASMAPRQSATLHFFDETMFSSRDRQGRLMQWSYRGMPAYAIEPSQQSYKYSVAALTSINASDPCLYCKVYDETTLATDVVDFFKEVLLETCLLRPGDTVVLDNAATHCGDTERLLRFMLRIFDVDLVYLPPYSPELNPIELVFAKVKYILRYHLPVSDTRAQKLEAIHSAFQQLTHSDLAGYYRHAGYGA